MDALFSQLTAQESKSLFQETDGKKIILWIWEKGESNKKIPINALLKKDFTITSVDDLIPSNLKRASLLGTFEYQGFYYFVKLLSRELENFVQFLCDPIIHKNERRKRKRFQIGQKSASYAVVIPFHGPPPIIQNQNSVISFLPIKLIKSFLSHLSDLSEGKPLYHLSFSLYDLSLSGLSVIVDNYESEFLKENQSFLEAFLFLNKEKLNIKNLNFVHKSELVADDQATADSKTKKTAFYRVGIKYDCDDWTSKRIQSMIEVERENVVKEYDEWSKD